MKVVRPNGVGTALYVLPDSGRQPLAGPFNSAVAARFWIVEKVESGLSPAKLGIWRDVSAKLPAPTDIGQELAVIGFIAHGMLQEQLAKYLPRVWRPTVDRKMIASGEAA